MAEQHVQLAKALAHPMRVRILTSLNTPTRRLSPKEFADSIHQPVSNVSYHFRELAKFGMIEVVETKSVRGATQHFYEPKKKALAWSKEWAALPPAVQNVLMATTLRAFFEETGRAIDQETFTAREDAHLSWDKMWVDERGWRDLTRLMNATLVRAMEIGDECKKRQEEGSAGFHVSYGLAAFESPDPPTAPPV